MLVKEIMTHAPTTVNPTTCVNDAHNVMREHDIRHLPVVNENGILVGMLSERDLQAFAFARLGLIESKEAVAFLKTPVSEIMSGAVVDVSQDTPVTELVTIFLEERIGAVPVTEPDTKKLTGIVSYIDLIRSASPYFEGKCTPH